MPLNLKTFAVDGELTYDDLDGNWGAIQDAFNNSALIPVKLYKLDKFTAVNTCEPDGSNNLQLHGNIQFLNNSSLFPHLKLFVTLNGNIVSINDLTSSLNGMAYPFVTNAEGGDIDLTVNIAEGAYPATVALYLIDQQGNFAQPVSLVIQDNPCTTPAEVIVLTTSVFAGGNLTITGNVVNGSNDYKVQYDNDGEWTDIATWTQVDGAIDQVAATAISGDYDVRILDILTNNVSNSITTTF